MFRSLAAQVVMAEVQHPAARQIRQMRQHLEAAAIVEAAAAQAAMTAVQTNKGARVSRIDTRAAVSKQPTFSR